MFGTTPESLSVEGGHDTGVLAQRQILLWVAAGCSLVFLVDLGLVVSGSFALRDESFRAHVIALCNNGFFQDIILNGIVADPYRDSMELVLGGVGSVAVLLVALRRRWSALFLLLSVGGALVLSALIKRAVVRPATVDAEASHSFPSGHATVSLVLFLTLIIVTWSVTEDSMIRRVVAIGASALLVVYGISSLLFHYPTEVLGGYALGGLWLSLLLVGFTTDWRIRWQDHR